MNKQGFSHLLKHSEELKIVSFFEKIKNLVDSVDIVIDCPLRLLRNHMKTSWRFPEIIRKARANSF